METKSFTKIALKFISTCNQHFSFLNDTYTISAAKLFVLNKRHLNRAKVFLGF